MYIHSAILLSAVHPGRTTLYSRILHVRLKILIPISQLMTNYCNRRIREVLCGAAAVLLCAGAFSCSKENDESQGGDAPHEGRARTVLVYMIGDVNLWQEQWTNLNRLEVGWNDDIDGNLLVYLDPSPHTTQFPNPVLLEIVPDQTDAIVSRVVKSYPEQNATDKAVMRGVLEDAIRMYPAPSQGLVIASHGSGWWPAFADELVPTDDEHDTPQTRAIAGGDRYGTDVEVNDLAELLPIKYDFILMHACLMGNVETAYALKDKCGMYVASSATLPGASLPFQYITEAMFAQPAADFYHLIQTSCAFYNTLPEDEADLLTLSAVRTDRLDGLATATRALMEKVTADPELFYDKLKDRAYTYEDSPYQDLRQVLALESEGVPELQSDYEAFCKALADAVVLTGDVYQTLPPDMRLHPDDFCGLTCYTPQPDVKMSELNAYFKKTYRWADASGFGLLVGYQAAPETAPMP